MPDIATQNKRKSAPAGEFARLWLFFAFFSLALALLLAYDLQREYREVTAREERRMLAQTRIVADNLGRQLEAVNSALASTIESLPVWRRSDDPDRANQRLAAMTAAMPGVRTFLVSDAQGKVIAANRPELMGRNFSYRDYFQTPLANPDPNRLYLSPPFQTVLSVFAMSATRMISGPNGEFAGVASVTLDPDYFSILLDSVLYAPDMRIALIHGSGRLFLLRPTPPKLNEQELTGKDMTNPASFFSQHQQRKQQENLFRSTSYLTGEERLMAMRTILPPAIQMDFPLVVGINRNPAVIYADWRHALWWNCGLFSALLLAAGLGLFAHQRRQQALRHAEQELLKFSRNFEAFLEQTTDFVYFKDQENRFVFCSRTLAEITGHRHWQEMVGKNDFDCFPPDTAKIYREEELPLFQEGKSVLNKINPYYDAAGKQGWVSTNKWPLLAPDGKTVVGVFGISRIVTEQQRLEKELAAQSTALARSNAELEQFAYVASHDLRQPLRMISSYIRLLDKELAAKLDDETRKYLGFVEDGAVRMDQMLVSLLEYSRVGRLGQPMTEMESRRAVDEALLFLAPLIKESAAEIRDTAVVWPRLLASPDELTRLFQNLIGNALKYRAPERRPLIELEVSREEKKWRFTVRDNGIGIDPAQFDRLFRVFQRLHPRGQYEGSGIGLAICRKIVERHGGRIEVESAGPGQGSAFSFTLPALPTD